MECVFIASGAAMLHGCLISLLWGRNATWVSHFIALGPQCYMGVSFHCSGAAMLHGCFISLLWGRNAAWVSHFIALGNKTLHAWISWSYMGLRFTPTKMMDVKWTSALTFVNTAAPDIELLHLTSSSSTSHRVSLPRLSSPHIDLARRTVHRNTQQKSKSENSMCHVDFLNLKDKLLMTSNFSTHHDCWSTQPNVAQFCILNSCFLYASHAFCMPSVKDRTLINFTVFMLVNVTVFMPIFTSFYPFLGIDIIDILIYILYVYYELFRILPIPIDAE